MPLLHDVANLTGGFAFDRGLHRLDLVLFDALSRGRLAPLLAGTGPAVVPVATAALTLAAAQVAPLGPFATPLRYGALLHMLSAASAWITNRTRTTDVPR